MHNLLIYVDIYMIHVENYRMLKIIEACLLSLANYMIVVWGNASKENLKIVERCIRSSARFLLSKRKHDRILRDIYENLSWLLPLDSHKYFSLCLVFKILRLKCIPYFNDILCPNLELHSHSTRGSNNLYLSNIRRNRYGVRSFFYSSVLLWNDLPDHLRNSGSFPIFKKMLKCFLLTDALQKCCT
jgi:hypothetical protein